MYNCKLSIQSKNGELLAQTEWCEQATLVYTGEYKPGDCILLEAESGSLFWDIRLDDSMLPCIVFMKEKTLRFDIPFDAQKIPYSPKSFSGNLHLLTAKPAEKAAVYARRNLAINPFDMAPITGVYPHASANIETRGEAVFAARNTIDGIYANSFHGEYPYQSWGINRDPEAALTIDLGIPCEVDEIRLTLRADFPHDNYWVQATMDFSDGSSEVFKLVKSPLPQSFKFSEKTIQSVTLHQLIQSDEPSPFPALTQIEIWGNVYCER